MFYEVQRVTELLLRLAHATEDLYDEKNTEAECAEVITHMKATIKSLRSEIDYFTRIITNYKELPYDTTTECEFYEKYISYIKEKINIYTDEIEYQEHFMQRGIYHD